SHAGRYLPLPLLRPRDLDRPLRRAAHQGRGHVRTGDLRTDGSDAGGGRMRLRPLGPRAKRALSWARRVALAGLAAGAVGCVALICAVWWTPLPEALATPPRPSLRVLDRGDRLLGEVRIDGGTLSAPVRLERLSPWVVPALLAAEDARFFEHPG